MKLDEISRAINGTVDYADWQSLDYNVKLLLEVFLGTVASGNRIVKNDTIRDDVASKHEVIAIETESVGVWNTFPTIVTQAGCDSASSHKNKKVQKYAATTAAACAKAVLEQLQIGVPKSVEFEPEERQSQTL